MYTPDEFEELVGSEIIRNNNIKNMQNGLFTLTWTNVRSALVYVVLTGLLELGFYVKEVGGILNVDWRTATNMLSVALVVGLISLVKNLLTTDDGRFLGVTKVV